MNKILIFGAGHQAQKYIHFFGKYGLNIEVVTYSGLLRKDNNQILAIHSFSSIQEQGTEFFSQFQYIIVAVSPLDEQEKVLQLLLNHDSKTPTIIEKPITYNHNTLEKILSKDSFLFFIDESVLSRFINSIEINNIHISTPKDRSIIEHSLGAFLLCPYFDSIINKISFEYIPQEGHMDSMSYSVTINNTISLECDCGKYYFGGKYISENLFEVNLKFLLTQGFGKMIDTDILRTNYFLLDNFLDSIDFPQM
ncbi:hypothetical protein K2X92_05665 [Candidatus Gracilibacteria bacterium]|nr:hypothetical protein [Candidatus Gracilibacteria bacterium]